MIKYYQIHVRNNWLGPIFFSLGDENKIILETLIVLWIKWTGMVEIRRKDVIDAVPIMPSFWIMGLSLFGEGRIQVFLNSTATLLGSMIDGVYTNRKIANNTKSNHILVSFTDHYNAISIDRLSSKTKIGKRFMVL